MEPIAVEVRRGAVVEAVHRVHAVAVQDGRAIASAGDPARVFLLRSSEKPFQAVPLLEAIPDATEAELAIACASHQGEPAQLDAVRLLLARAGADEDDLACGPQLERSPSRLLHNCSGKHVGMLAACAARGWPTNGYRLPGHPLQRRVLAAVAEAAGLPENELPVAVDGCGLPTHGMPLERMARAFTHLPPQLAAAMRARPELVGGEDADDTSLMRFLPGWTAKRGAEGLLCAVSPEGVGVALKSEDGNPRPLRPALCGFLRGLGWDVPEWAVVTLENSLGEAVGEAVATS